MRDDLGTLHPAGGITLPVVALSLVSLAGRATLLVLSGRREELEQPEAGGRHGKVGTWVTFQAVCAPRWCPSFPAPLLPAGWRQDASGSATLLAHRRWEPRARQPLPRMLGTAGDAAGQSR